MSEVDHVDRPDDDPATTWAEDNLRATLTAAAATVEPPPAFEERATERLADYPTHRSGSSWRPWLAAAAAVSLVLGGAAAVRAAADDPTVGVGGSSTGTSVPGTTAPRPLADVRVPIFRFDHLLPGMVINPPIRGVAITGDQIRYEQDLKGEGTQDTPPPPLTLLAMQMGRDNIDPGGQDVLRAELDNPSGGRSSAALRSFTSNGIDWWLGGGERGVYAEGLVSGVDIGFHTVARPMSAADLAEVERFLRGISIERWQPYLELAKFDAAIPATDSSFPDELTRCEYWTRYRQQFPNPDDSSLPPGC